MKAVLLRAYGGVDELHYEDVPDPRPQSGEVLVRMMSTSVNPIDYKIRSGAFQRNVELPVVLGRDVAGEITEIGAGVTKFFPGDLVMGLVDHSYAELLTAPADSLTKIPEGLDPIDAGALPLVTLTGAQLIERGLEPNANEHVLVTGAVGNVGRTAAFTARQRGSKVLFGVRSSQVAEARSLGADSVFALDQNHEVADLPELDGIADTVNGETIGKLLPKLKKSGRLASVLGTPESARHANIRVREVWAQPDPERLHQLALDFRDGNLKINIVRKMRLQEIRAAHEAAEKNPGGKIVILP